MLSTVTNSFQHSQSTYIQDLFNGSAASISDMQLQLQDGKWVDQVIPQDAYDMQSILAKILFAFMIPRAWPMNPRVHPVIVYVASSAFGLPDH